MAGGTVSRTAHFVLHRAPLPGVDEPCIGAVVPKRWAKRAVTRNGIKRQIYSVSASFASRLPAAAHVVRLRMDFARAEFPSAWSEPLKKAVRSELLKLFERAPRVVAPAQDAAQESSR
jgi:ribonuclease P protein component